MTDEIINRTELQNGIRVISEYVGTVYSVSLGFWVITGSKDDTASTSGIAHLIEHMMFKGTRKRTAFQIANTVESVGGIINAFTSKNVTCYFLQILHDHLEKGIDVLADLVLNDTFENNQLQKEKGIILEEIKEIEDTPGELIHDVFNQQIFPDHPLGWPIQGTRDSINSIQIADLMTFVAQNYTTGRLVVAASGRIEHARLVELVEKYCHTMQPGNDRTPVKYELGVPERQQVIHKPISQAHLILGRRIFPQSDPRRFQLALLNTLLSGGMSSRLFHNIREKYGFVYEVFSFSDLFFHEGVFGIYAGTAVGKLEMLKVKLYAEMSKLVRRKVPVDELEKVKQQSKSSTVFALENTNSRMSHLAKMEIYEKRLFTFAELLAIIEKISVEEIQQLAEYLFIPDQFIETVFLPEKSSG